MPVLIGGVGGIFSIAVTCIHRVHVFVFFISTIVSLNEWSMAPDGLCLYPRTISVAVGGMLKRHLAPQMLEQLLRNELCPEQPEELKKLKLLQKFKKKG